MTVGRGMAACALVLAAVVLASGSGCCTVLTDESLGWQHWRARERWTLRSCALERNVDGSLTLYLRIDRDGQLWDLTEHVVDATLVPPVDDISVVHKPVTTATPVRFGDTFPPRSPLDGREPVPVVLRPVRNSLDHWTGLAAERIRRVRADGVIESRTEALTEDDIATSCLLAYCFAEGWATLVAPPGSPPPMADTFSLWTGEPPTDELPAQFWIALPFLLAIDIPMLPLEIGVGWLIREVSGKTLSELLNGD